MTPTHWKSSQEICDAAGITYRQLNYWIHNDVIPARYIHGGEGSGHPRRIDPYVVERLAVLGTITAEFAPGLPVEQLARIFDAYDRGRIQLTDSLRVTWSFPDEG
jgi:hypothetical protein